MAISTLTACVAIYGAVLSTIVAVWNVVRALPKVRVLPTLAIESWDGVTEVGLGISVQNPSAQSVHISSISILYPHRHVAWRERITFIREFKRLPRRQGWCHSALSIHGVDDKCPETIEPGKAHYVFVPDKILKEIVKGAVARELRVVVQDPLWRDTYSKKYRFR